MSLNRVDTTLENTHEYIMGGSGSGKSYYVKGQIKQAPALIIFDPDDEYGELSGIHSFTSTSELLVYIKDKARYRVRLVRNGKKYFDWLCGVALLMGNCVFVAEEIADVTTAGKAGEHWGALVRRGRKYGVKIMAVSQRPSEADKTVFTQVNKIRSGRLDGEGDKKRVADNLGVPVEMVNNMMPLDYLELNRRSGELFAGHKQKRKCIRAGYGKPIIV